MGTMIKVAAQLQVGDIYTCQGGRAVVVHMADGGAFGVRLYTAVLGRQPLPMMVPPETTSWDAKFCVEVPEPAPLTPAQQHAEGLVQVARMVVANRFAQGTDILDLASGLLGKIDPPIPPTLAEVLPLLAGYLPLLNASNSRELSEGAVGMDAELDQARKVRDVLDRAKKAGML